MEGGLTGPCAAVLGMDGELPLVALELDDDCEEVAAPSPPNAKPATHNNPATSTLTLIRRHRNPLSANRIHVLRQSLGSQKSRSRCTKFNALPLSLDRLSPRTPSSWAVNDNKSSTFEKRVSASFNSTSKPCVKKWRHVRITASGPSPRTRSSSHWSQLQGNQ